MLPYQERVITERDELKVKYDALSSFIEHKNFDEIVEDPKQKALLIKQKEVMMLYLDILNERIALFK